MRRLLAGHRANGLQHSRWIRTIFRFSLILTVPSPCSQVSAQNIQFRDITAQAGIHFVHNNGAFGKKWLPETMGPGCAFIDYDNDGYPDIVLVNGEDWPGHPEARRPR